MATRSPSAPRPTRSQGVRLLVLAVAIAGVTIALVTAPASATFPGTDGRIAFDVVIPRTDSKEIFTAKPNGGDVQKLTSNPNAESELPDWSPDGQRIAFDSDRTDIDGRRHVAQIYVMNADGSGLTQLTSGPGPHVFSAWSPDAGSLAIAADWGNREALQGIWIIPASDPDGVTQEDARRVTTLPAGFAGDIEPQFSPDGSSIVFTRFKRASKSAIHRVGIDGTGLQRLTPWRLNASDPDWSPDGQRITFDSGDVGRHGSRGNIYVMRADGSGRTRLTNLPRFRPGERFNFANNPVWSPSGARIMYTHFLRSRGEFVAIEPDGSGKHVVLDRPRLPNKVDWGTHP